MRVVQMVNGFFWEDVLERLVIFTWSYSQPIKTAKDFKCPTFRVSSSLRRLRISKLTIKIIFDSKASSSVRPSRNGSNITEVTAKLKREYKVIKLLPIKIKIVIIIYYC